MREITGTACGLILDYESRLVLRLRQPMREDHFRVMMGAAEPLDLMRMIEKNAEVVCQIDAQLDDDLSAVVVVTSIRAVETTETGQ